jgi:hypothetical protein
VAASPAAPPTNPHTPTQNHSEAPQALRSQTLLNSYLFGVPIFSEQGMAEGNSCV